MPPLPHLETIPSLLVCTPTYQFLATKPHRTFIAGYCSFLHGFLEQYRPGGGGGTYGREPAWVSAVWNTHLLMPATTTTMCYSPANTTTRICVTCYHNLVWLVAGLNLQFPFLYPIGGLPLPRFPDRQAHTYHPPTD